MMNKKEIKLNIQNNEKSVIFNNLYLNKLDNISPKIRFYPSNLISNSINRLKKNDHRKSISRGKDPLIIDFSSRKEELITKMINVTSSNHSSKKWCMLELSCDEQLNRNTFLTGKTTGRSLRKLTFSHEVNMVRV